MTSFLLRAVALCSTSRDGVPTSASRPVTRYPSPTRLSCKPRTKRTASRWATSCATSNVSAVSGFEICIEPVDFRQPTPRIEPDSSRLIQRRDGRAHEADVEDRIACLVLDVGDEQWIAGRESREGPRRGEIQSTRDHDHRDHRERSERASAARTASAQAFGELVLLAETRWRRTHWLDALSRRGEPISKLGRTRKLEAGEKLRALGRRVVSENANVE